MWWSFPVALDACTTSRTRGLHLPVCGHGFRNRAALAALAGDLTTWRELWRNLEDVRRALGVARWVVLGHSWGSDLAVRYALDHPERVAAVVGIAGHGLHKDRNWSEIYEAQRHTEEAIHIDWNQQVHAALNGSFLEWIHEPGLYRSLADSPVRMRFIAASNDIRPDWPLRQLAELVPAGSFELVEGVDHNFWTTDPERWIAVVTAACTQM
jgi:proline iminopeptidase